MTDVQDATPDPTPDPTDEPIDTESGIDIEGTLETARKNFSLSQRLKRGKTKLIADKIIVFTDMAPVQAYQAIHAEAELQRALLESLGKVKDLEPSDKVKHKAQVKLVAEIEGREEAARAEMLEGALVVFLRAYPDAAVKIAHREARNIFYDRATMMLKPEFDSEEVSDWVEKRLVSEAIQRIVDPVTGEEIELDVPKAERGLMLSASLHAAQWQRLLDKYNEVCLLSGIVTTAIDDNPGF